MSLTEAADYLRNHTWNRVTPRRLMERFNLSSEDLKQLCRENPDITVVMHVNREKPVDYSGLPTYVHLKDKLGDVPPREIVQLWRDVVTIAIQQVFIAFSRMHRVCGETHIWEQGPVDLDPLAASEWPEMWWQLDSQLIGGTRYRIKIEAEWDVATP